jgi:hypothetical protein
VSTLFQTHVWQFKQQQQLQEQVEEQEQVVVVVWWVQWGGNDWMQLMEGMGKEV